MTVQAPQKTRKLAFLVGAVILSCVAIATANHGVSQQESASDPDAMKNLDHALAAMTKEPAKWSVTFNPGPAGERTLRRLHVPRVLAADVLVLGQSDADHMSGTFFREEVKFYNGFISNSYFEYQWEVFDQFVQLGTTPRIVLWDVRSGYILQRGTEPTEDAKPTDAVWFAGPPFQRGQQGTSSAWWTQIDSLLSLRQTEHTFDVLVGKRGAGTGRWAASLSAFELVAKDNVSASYRWIADGSRVYPNEDRAGIKPRHPKLRLEEPVGRRKVQDQKAQMLAVYLDRILASGARLIVYAPPIHPASYDDPAQLPPLGEYAAKIRAITEPRKIDFCDLTTKAKDIGCTVADFYDELHLSRNCNERVVRELVSGCAPLAGGVLRATVSRQVLAN